MFDLFFNPIESAIAATRAFTEPAVSIIPPGSCGIPASKLWFALSQVPVRIVCDAIVAVSTVEPTPEPPGSDIPESPPTVEEPTTIEGYIDRDLTADIPIEEVGSGGFWKAAQDPQHLGIAWKTYKTKADAKFYGELAQLWCTDWRIIKLDSGYKLQVAYIERDRWEKVVSGALNPRKSAQKPKRERLTEIQQSQKIQLENLTIAELFALYRQALMAGFVPEKPISTISRDQLIKALLHSMELKSAA